MTTLPNQCQSLLVSTPDSIFARDKALTFFMNHIRRLKYSVSEKEYWGVFAELPVSLVEEIMDECVPDALCTRWKPLAPFWTDDFLHRAWDDTLPEARNNVRIVLEHLAIRIRLQLDQEGKNNDPLADRFPQLCAHFSLTPPESDYLLLRFLFSEGYLWEHERERHSLKISLSFWRKQARWLDLSSRLLRQIAVPEGRLRQQQLLHNDLDFNRSFLNFLYHLSDELPNATAVLST